MSSKQDIWMPLFIGDYLRDTTRLTTEKHGAYLLLIMDYWINGAPPDDDEVLASITKMQVSAWRKARPALQQLFNVVDGKWLHKRIEEELSIAKENSIKYADRAKKAADKRWGKDSKSNASSNATSIPNSNTQDVHEDMLADATSPSPSSNIGNSESVCNEVADQATEKTHTQIQVGLIAQGLTAIGMMPFNPSLPEFIALIDAGATVDEFVNTALEKKGDSAKFNFKYLLATMTRRRQEAAQAKPMQKGAMASVTSREAGRNAASKSVFTPENTRHLQSKQFQQVGAENEVTAITG